MLVLRTLLFFVVKSIFASAECDDFKNGVLCPLYPLENIVGVISNVKDEVECQEECTRVSGCQFFTYEVFTKGTSECFLFSDCRVNETSSCKETSDCEISISGPVTPSITTSCCSTFSNTACSKDYEIDEIFDIFDEEICQNLCRDTADCTFYTLLYTICFLYSACDNAHSCDNCLSGPAFPDISKCSSNQVLHTLLLGGSTSSSDYSTSIELITPTMTCTAGNELPVGRQAASAAVLGSTIYYCGGYNNGHHNSCHSYNFNENSNQWAQEDSMKIARQHFGMSVIGSTIYVTGGVNGNYLNSVESFELERGWRIEETMQMSQKRYQHCSAALESHLIVIGGYVSGYRSESVMSFDTQDQNKEWMTLKSLNVARSSHACQEGAYEGIQGIFVTGGYGAENSVEFYVKDVDTWRILGDMKTNRDSHSLSIVNGQLVAAGGYNNGQLTSVEALNETEWIVTNNLQSGREGHAAVSVPAGIITC